MSAPTFDALTEALAPPLAGDPHDDDAQIIDDLFEPASGPPDVEAAKQDYADHSQVAPKKQTRVMSGFQQIDVNTVSPIQIQPFDPNRERIIIRVTSATATDYILVADEANKCNIVASTSGQAGRLPVGVDMILEGHNGPVFVMFGAGAAVIVSWWAITS
jgi:hypothetical protein